MDTLHHMLRAIRRETKSRPDHTAVFRAFIRNIERLGMSRPASNPKGKAAASKPRVARKASPRKASSRNTPSRKAPPRKR